MFVRIGQSEIVLDATERRFDFVLRAQSFELVDLGLIGGFRQPACLATANAEFEPLEAELFGDLKMLSHG